jgi:hypothetical protein
MLWVVYLMITRPADSGQMPMLGNFQAHFGASWINISSWRNKSGPIQSTLPAFEFTKTNDNDNQQTFSISTLLSDVWGIRNGASLSDNI